MKRWIFLIGFLAGFLPAALAQTIEPIPSRTAKSQTFFSLNFQNTRQKLTDNRFYRTPGLEISASNYFLRRLAGRVSVAGQQYNALEMLSPAAPVFDEEKGWIAGAQLRYNFWELPRFGTAFVQTGFSRGRISGPNLKAINRWEILTAGETLYLQKLGFPKLALEISGSLGKESLSKKLNLAGTMGLNYYLNPRL